MRHCLRGPLLLTVGAISLALAGCAVNPAEHAGGSGGLTRVTFAALPGWSAAQASTGLASFIVSCKAIEVMPEDQSLGGAGVAARLAGKAGLWRGVCAAARAVPPGDAQAAQRFFQTSFVPYEANVGTVFTGYFEPVYAASVTQGRGYDVPLYARPRDLVPADSPGFRDSAGHPRRFGRTSGGRLVPYFTRAEIEAGAIRGQAQIIAWLRDPVDAYLAEVQGSARLSLPDGGQINIGFDGTNGRAYTPIGKPMVRKGYLEADDVSIQSISTWLRGHPAEATALMDANRNYVFFKQVDGVPEGMGAPGALGVPLTPEGSIAIDQKSVPLGAPVFVATKTLDRLTVAQDIDVGAKQLAAAQIFYGIGRAAATRTGAMDEAGRMFVLLPRPVAAASSGTTAPQAGAQTGHESS